ncbi:hypothetical protein PN465_01380 [Nodularia spumigena CS-584]|jgi:orotate phosphoribosyltransferase-like protein|uniref:Uncharacterized protein n=1 Tax=Nodularia spumigena UHCC 0060 TaxID=3110300 RepID=A0ABU5UTM1_NODSP|nr:hypothetical protein [Nodularia spumigena]MDB9317075.1 hypothetical protein [Nodularia spumigena CS-590/01A]MDB9328693.1 hypothetical protein [Nodularia spumigena CS-590/02]MDB9333466.1 hypothetical protein [Nodularia spumigena CS-590/01]MDB9380896.1 hypothetical protein [Nodularia spumigena CS-584]MEA5524600.1 hypothetical protein [Nodularia spumigena UHCC 0143]
MMSSNLREIERDLSGLSLEELEWLLERIQKQMKEKQQTSDIFINMKYMQEQLAAMAIDSDIQTEISTINQEFFVTEMDGLSQP